MKKKSLWIVGVLLLALVGWAFVARTRKPPEEIQYKYEAITKGTLLRSISATGVLEARTTVDVKSKAGGRVVKLAVDIGSPVRQGQLIATIDPSDTQATYEQASADLQSAQARAAQAETNYRLQLSSSEQGVRDARVALQQAETRLQRVRIQARQQPTMTSSSIASAEAAYNAAVAAQQRVARVTTPQTRREAESGLTKAKTDLDTAQANFSRQQELLAKGYVSQAAVDQARSSLEGARAAYSSAQQRSNTLDQEIASSERAAAMDVERARAALEQAKASGSDVAVAGTNVAEAVENVRQARIALDRAISQQLNNRLRLQDIVAAKASTVRNRVAVQNAKVQLESTTVVAPRDGVVTQKYLEEGTIIPPGTSTFSQGTSLVQISDVSEMFVECAVDEADVGSVALGQHVSITTEAFPKGKLRGIVDRISPAAKTDQNVTSVQVRVRILPGYRDPIKPGMNATCEFITLEKKDVLIAPSQAIKRGANGSYVLLKGADPKKPVQQPIKTGEDGNEGVEVLSGLKEGDQVVTAELNLAALKAIQDKMQQEQSQSGGLAGGGFRGPQSRGTTAAGRGAAGGGGASRSGGGMGRG